ncbi:MAG TPA: hypothetical protein VHY20_00700 [Pirellulales bacterium]|nr:hypothetical protein [Pirellulales bacterium]
MSVGPLGAAGSFAGVPLAQTRGSEIERAAQQAQAHERQVRNQTKAADAEGIAATDNEDNQPQDRDADGRRLWERAPSGDEADAQDVLAPESDPNASPSGESGTQLDLSG